jgi:hypothetical protein
MHDYEYYSIIYLIYDVKMLHSGGNVAMETGDQQYYSECPKI